MPYTFKTLKEDTLRGYKRHTFVSGTVASTGGNTAFTDVQRTEPDRYWSLDGADNFLKFSTGSNNGAVRRVSGYSTNGSFTFSPALTASLAVGDGYALFKGPHPDNDIGLAINEARRTAFPERTVSSVATLNEQDAVYVYTIPSAAQSTVQNLQEIRRSFGTINNDHNYTILRRGFDFDLLDVSGTTRLQLHYLPVPSLILTFIGQGPMADLSADTDTTDEPAEVIIAGARHFLAMQEGNRDLADYWLKKFEDAKKDYSKSVPNKQIKRPIFNVGSY